MLGNKKPFVFDEERFRLPQVVCCGGGHGLAATVHPIRIRRKAHVIVVQNATDDGGSSKRFRFQFGMLPPGDPTSAMVAMMADDQMEIGKDFLNIRLPEDESFGALSGASMKNLMMLGFYLHAKGNFMVATQNMSRFLRVGGTILPVTLEDVHLEIHWSDGTISIGEGEVDLHPLDGIYIDRVRLTKSVEPYHLVIETIEKAEEIDCILICPGSVHTSIVATLLPDGVTRAIRNSKAKLLAVSNLFSDPRECPSEYVSASIGKICQIIGRLFDAVFCNTQIPGQKTLKRYAAECSFPLQVDTQNLQRYAKKTITGNFLQEEEGKVRHSTALTDAIEKYLGL